MKAYVLGFLFDSGCDHVALILKQRPDWQRGLLNGVGGAVEKGEKPAEAMVREFAEETGRRVGAWRHFATMTFDEATVQCYEAEDAEAQPALERRTDEAPRWVALHEIDTLPTVANTRLLVTLALAKFERVILCPANNEEGRLSPPPTPGRSSSSAK